MHEIGKRFQGNGMRLFIFGIGYTAQALIATQTHRFSHIAGTVRTAEKAQALRARGIDAHVFDDADSRKPAEPALLRALESADTLLAGIPPGEAGDPALALLTGTDTPAAPEATESQRLFRFREIGKRINHIGYLSTIGVYGDHGGAWVDETSLTLTRLPRSLRRLDAEAAWLALARSAGARPFVFRLPGIYGPGRNNLRDLAAGTARNIVKAGHVFNRAHVDDIAAAIAAAMAQDGPEGVYNVTDDEPAAQGDVVAFAARLLGVPPPQPVDIATARLPETVRSFHVENKRVSNARLKALPGFRLAYPTYREGLAALHALGEGSAIAGTDSR